MTELRVNQAAVARNLSTYGTFAASERILMEAVRAGADRQVIHELIREHSLAAWGAIEAGGENPLGDLLANDPQVLRFLPSEQVLALMDASGYVGDAPQRARRLAGRLRFAGKEGDY